MSHNGGNPCSISHFEESAWMTGTYSGTHEEIVRSTGCLTLIIARNVRQDILSLYVYVTEN